MPEPWNTPPAMEARVQRSECRWSLRILQGASMRLEMSFHGASPVQALQCRSQRCTLWRAISPEIMDPLLLDGVPRARNLACTWPWPVCCPRMVYGHGMRDASALCLQVHLEKLPVVACLVLPLVVV